MEALLPLIIWFLLILIIFFIIFVLHLRWKLDILEEKLKIDFKIRNYKIISLYYISEKYLNKHDEVFKEYKNLLNKDFKETSLNFYFENKLDTYKKIHKEIDFIFKICEKNGVLTRDPKYSYIKDEIVKKWWIIWKNYDEYKIKLKNYEKYHKISKYFIIWLFLR